MTGSPEGFDVTTVGSRGRARAMPLALAPGGVQLELQFATGGGLRVTFTAVEAGELMRQLGTTSKFGGSRRGLLCLSRYLTVGELSCWRSIAGPVSLSSRWETGLFCNPGDKTGGHAKCCS
jgi:hypothetical protein